MPRRPVLIFAAIILLIAAGFGSYTYMNRALHQQQGSGVALVGGPFSLVDQDGRRVTEKDFLGKYMLVFFGYTYCPDICPTDMQRVAQGLKVLKGQDPDKAAVQKDIEGRMRAAARH